MVVMPAIKELERNIECCRREIRNLVVMGMNPSQTPDQLELIRNLERSARAELRLRVTALQCAVEFKVREPKIKFQPTFV